METENQRLHIFYYIEYILKTYFSGIRIQTLRETTAIQLHSVQEKKKLQKLKICQFYSPLVIHHYDFVHLNKC